MLRLIYIVQRCGDPNLKSNEANERCFNHNIKLEHIKRNVTESQKFVQCDFSKLLK